MKPTHNMVPLKSFICKNWYILASFTEFLRFKPMLSRLHQCQISYNKETSQMNKDCWVSKSYHKLNTATSSWVVHFFQSNSFLITTLLYIYNIKRLREFNEMSKLQSLTIQGLITTLCKICHIAPAPLMYDFNYLKTAFTIAHYVQTHVRVELN